MDRTSAGEPGPRRGLSEMATILVVDDEPDIRLLIQMTLERDGHDTVMANDGAEALVAVHDARPDVVVLDVMMPEVDGWTVLKRLKADDDPDISAIPVLMLTALGAPIDQVKGGIEGAVRECGIAGAEDLVGLGFQSEFLL